MNGYISEELNSYPVYGLGNSIFGFTTHWKLYSKWIIDLNFTHSAFNKCNKLIGKKIDIGQQQKLQ